MPHVTYLLNKRSFKLIDSHLAMNYELIETENIAWP